MTTRTFTFYTEAEAIEFTRRFNRVEHTVSLQQIDNIYLVVVQYWSLD